MVSPRSTWRHRQTSRMRRTTVRPRRRVQPGRARSIRSLFVALVLLGIGALYLVWANQLTDRRTKNENVNTNTAAENTDTNAIVNINSEKSGNANHATSRNANTTPPPPRTFIAIIIDDIGNQGLKDSPTKDLLALDSRMALAIIPERAHSKEVAAEGKRRGFDVIIHQPMEPLDPAINPGKGAIFSTMSVDEILSILSSHIDELSEAGGLNNHMGSKVTSSAPLMDTILGVLKEKGLYFVDSVTVSTSVAYERARARGVPAAKRDVFLDGEDDTAYIRGQIEKLAKLAISNPENVPVGIGHIRPKTIAVLKDMLPELAQQGIGLKRVPEIVR